MPTFVEVLERAGVDGSEVGDVVTGCVQQYGEQSYNIGRNAWLQAGLPIETPATTIDRQCGSAQQAVNFAASLVASGVHDVVIGGGVEHMGHIPLSVNTKLHQELGSPFPHELLDRFPLVHQGLSAELIAEKWAVTREDSDEIALRSQQRAARATEEGRFEREILPYPVNGHVLTTDQGIRAETTLEGLAALKPAFKEDGTITAGNSSQVSDGASALLLMSRQKADDLGVTPRARILDHTTVGVDPVLDAHRTDPRDAQDPGAKRPLDRRPRPYRDQRGVRVGDRCVGAGTRTRTSTRSTSTAARSPSAIPSARPAGAFSRRSSTSSSARTARSGS